MIMCLEMCKITESYTVYTCHLSIGEVLLQEGRDVLRLCHSDTIQVVDSAILYLVDNPSHHHPIDDNG